jgi:UDP-N-acetyl-D-glucosamine dehydrogenase
MTWKTCIDNRDARVAVIGLGYVGLPLAVEIAKAELHVVGIDVSEPKVKEIGEGRTSLTDVDAEELQEVVKAGRLCPTTSIEELNEVDAIIICVPTPLNKTKDPDISYIVNACTGIAKHLKKNQLVVLESTTYPGFTREVAVPLLEESGLKAGEDFFVSFSPERIDPGNATYSVENTAKIIGGLTEECGKRTEILYNTFISQVHRVSSPDAAEMVKLLENTFRAVNIGLVNEVAQMCHKLEVNTWEVIDAAATKPFGFMPFYPGPGLGGHCIPIDPLYLSWKLRALNYQAQFIELADAINTRMPGFVVRLVQDALNDHATSLKGSSILVLGVAYKRDIDDCRESPALEIIESLEEKGASVAYHDPYVPTMRLGGHQRSSVSIDGDLSGYNVILITTDHSTLDYDDIVSRVKVVVDTRNATKAVTKGREKIYLL